MKKYLFFTFALILSLTLCACGKSEAVKTLEAKIEALDTATTSSGPDIVSIDSAYSALSEKEQTKVSNYTRYLAFRDAFYRLFMEGEWFNADPNFWNILSNDNTMGFRLYSDGTWDSNACGHTEGTWILTDGVLSMTEAVQGYEYNCLEVIYDGSMVSLGFYGDDRDHTDFLRDTDYEAWLGEYFLILDLETVELDQYLDFAHREYQDTDIWGDPTGNTFSDILLHNKLLDQGWIFLDTVGDFAIEVLCPAYPVTHHDLQSGSSHTSTREATSITLRYDIFMSPIIRDTRNGDYEEASDLSPEALTFGRGKGKLVFVNSKYVTVAKDENGNNQRILIWNRNDCPMTYHSGTWAEDYPY